MRAKNWIAGLLLFEVVTFITSEALAGSLSDTNATRIALVGTGGLEIVLDTTTTILSKDADLQLLDRMEVGRVLQEQAISLAGQVRAEDAIKAGRLLHVDLFAVLEGTPTNSVANGQTLGLVVFNAKTGVRYADSALLATNVTSAAVVTAAAIRAAVVKSQRSPQGLHTVGLLSVRNADLPRQFDSICDSVGLLLERELTASPEIAVLERRRLEQVNQERSVAPDAEGNRLLASLEMMKLDISRDGEGLRGTLVFAKTDGTPDNKITVSIPSRNPAMLAHLLADKARQFLNVSVGGAADRKAEAERFHGEYSVLGGHGDYRAALHALDAAIALAPEKTHWSLELSLLLFKIAAIEAGPSDAELTTSLALAHRGADLLLDLSRTAAAQAKPGDPIPEVLQIFSYAPFESLLDGLMGGTPGREDNRLPVAPRNPVIAAQIAALVEKDRILKKDIIPPYLFKQSVDKDSFRDCFKQFDLDWLKPSEIVTILRDWVAASHKFNPPDGSGEYLPLELLLFYYHFEGNEIPQFWQSLEQDQDLLIRMYAQFARVMSIPAPFGYGTDETFQAEHQFRLHMQEVLEHGEAAKLGPLHDKIWSLFFNIMTERLLNHPACAQELLEASRFAIAQNDIQINIFRWTADALARERHMFNNGVEVVPSPADILERQRRKCEKMEILNAELKLIQESPDFQPPGYYGDRNDLIQNLQQEIEQLAGNNTNVTTTPWKNPMCLLDFANASNGLAWLYNPIIQDDQVYFAALGFREWGLPEDTLQLMRVSLHGGTPTMLGRTKIEITDWPVWQSRASLLERSQTSRLKREVKSSNPAVRVACIGGGYYFAATCSGIYIFPLDGGPVQHLNADNGLPSDNVRSLAFLDGKLYLGTGEISRAGYLAAYNPATRQIDLLASSRRSEHLSPLDDQPPFYILGLVADASRHRLIIAISSGNYAQTAGLWSYSPVTSEFKRLTALRLTATEPAWVGLVAQGRLVAKDEFVMSLFDLADDHLLSVSCRFRSWTNGISAPALPALQARDTIGAPGNFRLTDGPFFLADGWFYSARPFERAAMSDGRIEKLTPLRTDYPFAPTECFQLLADGKHILAADAFSLWLLELKPDQAHVSVNKGNNISATTGR